MSESQDSFRGRGFPIHAKEFI